MVDDVNKPVGVSPAFNAAIDTLMRLSDILRKITELSLRTDLSVHNQQFLKYRLVKDFFIQASPLINDEEEYSKIKNFIINLELKWAFLNDHNGKPVYLAPGVRKKVRSFSESTERNLDKVIMYIQRLLQKQGYFMPPPKDKNLGGKEI